MENLKEQKLVSRDEVMARLESDIEQDLSQLSDNLQKLGHGQKTRLIKAIFSYPKVEEDFSTEPDLNTVYIAFKRVSDVQVALGVEMVVKELLDGQEQNGIVPNTQGENNV